MRWDRSQKSFRVYISQSICILICLFIAIYTRTHNSEFVLSIRTGHFNFIDTDCYYYLRRLVHFIENFPSIMVFDPLADWPRGSPVDWPEGFLVLLGLPLKLAGVSDFKSLEVGVSILMISLGLVGVFTIFKASRLVIDDLNLRILLLLFSACNFLLVRFSCLGQVDHHILEAIFPPLVFLLAYKSFVETSRLAAMILGCIFTYALSISSSSIFIITLFFIAYGMLLGSRENIKNFFWTYGVFMLSLAFYAEWSFRRRGFAYADNFPSYFHIELFFAIGILSLILYFYRRYAIAIFVAVGALGFLAHLVRWPIGLVSQLENAFQYVFGRSGILQNVSEAFPIFASFDGVSLGFMHINFGMLIYLLPMAWVLLFLRTHLSRAEYLLIFLLSGLSVPSIAQKRFSHLMVGLYLIFIIWLLQKVFVLTNASRAFEVLDRRIRGAVQIGLMGLWIVLGIAYSISEGGLAPYGSARDAVDLGTSQVFLDKVRVDSKIAWDRLAGKIPVTDGIWVNPNMGHMLTYFTGLGTLSNSFYHPESLKLDFDLRSIESTEALESELRRNRIRYLILADDWQFFDLQFQMEGKSSARFKEMRYINGNYVTAWVTQEFMKLAWVRLLMSDEETSNIPQVFAVQFNERHYYNYLRGFELKN